MSSHALIIESIDINANVLTHQANTERLSKPTDFEWFPGHFSETTRQGCDHLWQQKTIGYPSIISVSRITAASSESRSPRIDRSLMLALPMMASLSSTMQTFP